MTGGNRGLETAEIGWDALVPSRRGKLFGH